MEKPGDDGAQFFNIKPIGSHMTEAVPISARMALLTFLVSSMLAAGLRLTPSAILTSPT